MRVTFWDGPMYVYFLSELFKLILLKTKHFQRCHHETWLQQLKTLQNNVIQRPAFIRPSPHVLSTYWCIIVSTSTKKKYSLVHILYKTIWSGTAWQNANLKMYILYVTKLDDQIAYFSLISTLKWTFLILTRTNTKNMRLFLKH